MDNIKNINFKNVIAKIYYDETAESPREWDNLGTIVDFLKSYKIGDNHNYKSPKELLMDLYFEKCMINGYIDDLKNKEDLYLLKEVEKQYVIVPFYAYIHSGITISLSPFSCGWDSGLAGWIYVSKDDIRKEFNCKYITKKIVEKVLSVFKNEINLLNSYLVGNCYKFKIIDKQTNEILEYHIDYIGDINYCIEDAIRSAKYHNNKIGLANEIIYFNKNKDSKIVFAV